MPVKWMILVLASLIITRAGYVESCIEQERLALLHLDSYLRSLEDPEYAQFFGGIGEGEEDKYNCCSWKRVKCNTATRHVVELDLSNLITTENHCVFNVTMLQPFRKLTSLDLSSNQIISLVDKDGSTRLSTLKNLQSLLLYGDLVSGNCDVGCGQINLSALTSLKTLTLGYWGLNDTTLQGIEALTELQELDLSFNNFGGSIFQRVCVLKNLLELKLAYNDFIVPPSCLQNMSSLQIVDLSNSNLHGRFEDIIPSNLISLRYLNLSYNNLKGELLPNVFQNLMSLEHLDLSGNNFDGKLSLSSFANHSKLHFLDLSQNRLQVQTEDSSWRPSFQLQHLELPGCSLNVPNGTVPMFLSGQNNLSFIDLSDNNLVGPFPSFLISNTSMLGDFGLENDTRRPLEIVRISGNNFYGELPENIGFIFPRLKVLNVSSCHFEGPIPTSIALMSQLEVLDLSFNNFSGDLPRELLSDLTRLKMLILNDNHLEGEIIPDYMNLPGLKDLKLRNNHFGGTIKDALRNSSQLSFLDISNNKVTGSLPRWIGEFYYLGTLSVAENAMDGQIPTGICEIELLTYLDLSENNFNGSMPSCSLLPSLSVMLLRRNKLTGGIPSALSSASQLFALDLRDNQLSGVIPLWINKLQLLQILLLAGNNFRGQIPHQVCQLRHINLLDLSRNQLSGTILSCFGNMSFGFQSTSTHPQTGAFQPYREVYFYYTSGVDEIDDLLVKTLYLPYVGFGLSHMSVLDLSNNNFSGIIPPELGNLQHVHSINLSRNCLSGSIPDNLSSLKEIEGLDLSYNNLSGIIPHQLGQLYSLEKFNVSYNNLTGRTPEEGQFGNFDERSYLGNPRLCVSLVSKSCNAVSNKDAHPPKSTTIEEDGGEGLDVEDFLWSFVVTFFIAFMATITVLCINQQWGEAFFDFVEWHLLWWLL